MAAPRPAPLAAQVPFRYRRSDIIALIVLLLNGLLFPVWWRVYDKVSALSERVSRIEGALGVGAKER